MEKLDIENLSLQDAVEKINELVDFSNLIIDWRIEEIEKDLNEIMYGKRITNEMKIQDMRFRAKQTEIIKHFLEDDKNGKT